MAAGAGPFGLDWAGPAEAGSAAIAHTDRSEIDLRRVMVVPS